MGDNELRIILEEIVKNFKLPFTYEEVEYTNGYCNGAYDALVITVKILNGIISEQDEEKIEDELWKLLREYL